jgi:hypothetical protein
MSFTDYHSQSLALKDWLDLKHTAWTDGFFREPRQAEAVYCEAKDPSTGEVVWDDYVYDEEGKKECERAAAGSGLSLVFTSNQSDVLS